MLYILFHKPYGVVTQFSAKDAPGARTLAEFIKIPGIYPVGRLDKDSEGLLLITDDGVLQHRLNDPRFGHPRTYWVQVEGTPTPDQLDKLRHGVDLDGVPTRPAAARLLATEPALPPRDPPVRFRKSIPTAWIELTLTEGRNRQVRRMTAAVGLPTLRLVRAAIGNIRLGTLAQGVYRKLTPGELSSLRSS